MKLGLIFTRKISLAFWERVGNLNREVHYYNTLARSCETIFFFTHGTRETDARFRSVLAPNIHPLYRPWWIPTTLYAFLMPFVHSRAFREIDIIKTNQMDSSWSGVIAKRLFKKKLIVRCGYEWLDFVIRGKRGWLKTLIAKTVERVSYSAADRIIITSDADKNFIMHTFGTASEKISIIPNYVDTDRFAPLNVIKERGRILFVGRMESQKNLLMLVDALAGLPANLVIAGSGSMKNEITKRAEEKNVHIEFLGNIAQKDLPNELARSELFVLPSLYEGNPKTLLEAMATGVPCVGTDVKGIREVIRSGETGLLAAPDVVSIRSCIEKVLGNSELRARLGDNGRQEIVRWYALSRVVENELGVYHALLGNA